MNDSGLLLACTLLPRSLQHHDGGLLLPCAARVYVVVVVAWEGQGPESLREWLSCTAKPVLCIPEFSDQALALGMKEGGGNYRSRLIDFFYRGSPE